MSHNQQYHANPSNDYPSSQGPLDTTIPIIPHVHKSRAMAPGYEANPAIHNQEFLNPFQSGEPEIVRDPNFRDEKKVEIKDEKIEEAPRAAPPKPAAPKPAPIHLSDSVKFWTWFSPYRQILVFTIAIQVVAIMITLSGIWIYPRTHLSAMVGGNLLVAVAIRSEWVMRFLYWSSIKLIRGWAPMNLRVLVVAFLYHIGGLHSGCGVGAMMWLGLSWSYHLLNRELYHSLVLGTLFLSLAIVTTTCIVATPLVRAMYHNVFEMTHRFLGWAGILSSLAFVLTSSWWDINTSSWKTSTSYLVHLEEFWYVIALFPLVIGQWITVRYVPVTVSAPSAKASVIRVPGGLTSGVHTRVSRGGLREWHIFGSVSEGRNSDCHYIVMAVQGGFTRAMNREQPAKLYTKTWKPCGLPYFSRLFTKGVAICTGSGIGAVGSTCIQHDDWYLIWIGADLEKTYGKDLMTLITTKVEPHRLLVWDTKGPLGRPDVNVELARVFKEWNAQVALFIGSPALNQSVLRTSRARGIPVFGSIWDA